MQHETALKRCMELTIAPDATLNWHDGAMYIHLRRARRVLRVSHPAVVEILHCFASPSTIDEAFAQMRRFSQTELERTVRELMLSEVLVPLHIHIEQPPSTQVITTADDASGGCLQVIFVLPPSLGQFGEVRIPSGILMLASLTHQAGFSTDFLLAASLETRNSCPTDCFFVPTHYDLAPPLLLMQFAEALTHKLVEAVANGKRPVLAISCFSSSLYLSTILLGAYVRSRFPRLLILTGGYHPTIDAGSMIDVVGTRAGGVQNYRQYRQMAGSFFSELDRATSAIEARRDFVFDYVFQGRAETSLLHVLNRLVGNYCRPARSEIVTGGAFNDQELRAFRYSNDILSRLAGPRGGGPATARRRFDLCFSLGCPYGCYFCINSTRHEQWQGISVEHAIDTMEYLHFTHDVRHFSVLDANFGVRASWRRRFFDLVSRKAWAPGIQLDIEASVLNFDLPDYNVLDSFGLTIQVGVESCSEEMLLRMNKTRNPGRYKAKLARLINAVSPHADLIGLMLIFGYPGETKKTLSQSLHFLYEECGLLNYPSIAVVPQIYLPLLGTESVKRTECYRAELGFEPNVCAWWQADAKSRFDGLRPSRELSLEACTTLCKLIWDYHFGVGYSTESPGPPPISLKTKLAKSEFLQRLFQTLAED